MGFQVGDIVSHSYNNGAEYEIVDSQPNISNGWFGKVLKVGVRGEFLKDSIHPMMGDYLTFLRKAEKNTQATTTTNGVVCKSCNTKNEWGAPNQTDGSYVCFECR